MWCYALKFFWLAHRTKMCDITYLRPTPNAQPCTVLVAALDKQTN